MNQTDELVENKFAECHKCKTIIQDTEHEITCAGCNNTWHFVCTPGKKYTVKHHNKVKRITGENSCIGYHCRNCMVGVRISRVAGDDLRNHIWEQRVLLEERRKDKLRLKRAITVLDDNRDHDEKCVFQKQSLENERLFDIGKQKKAKILQGLRFNLEQETLRLEGHIKSIAKDMEIDIYEPHFARQLLNQSTGICEELHNLHINEFLNHALHNCTATIGARDIQEEKRRAIITQKLERWYMQSINRENIEHYIASEKLLPAEIDGVCSLLANNVQVSVKHLSRSNTTHKRRKGRKPFVKSRQSLHLLSSKINHEPSVHRNIIRKKRLHAAHKRGTDNCQHDISPVMSQDLHYDTNTRYTERLLVL